MLVTLKAEQIHTVKQSHLVQTFKAQALAVALEGFPDDEPLSPGAIAGVLGKKRPERWQVRGEG